MIVNKINMIVISGLSDKKLRSKLLPIVYSNNIIKVFLVRRKSIELKKVISFSTESISSSKLLGEILRIYYLFKILINQKVNVIMGYYINNHIIYAYYLSRIFKIPYIANIIGDELSSERKIRKYIRFALKANYIIVRGNSTRDFFIAKGYDSRNIFVIPNLFEFKQIPIDTFKSFKYDLIFIGNFAPVKRIDILIRAVSKIINKLPQIKICIVGEGELKIDYFQLINELGLHSNFDFVGEQKSVDEFLLASKVFIMTSEFEGLPQAMLEALAFGLPVIMPNISNIPDYAFHNYNALLVDPLDAVGFADAIYKLMSDDELYNKLKSGAQNFKSDYEYEFSMENITNIWNQVFLKLGSC